MFLLLLAVLSVCPSDNLECKKQIYMKLPSEVCFGSRNTQLNFRDDPDYNPDHMDWW